MMASKLAVAMLVLVSHIAVGATPKLAPFKTHDMSVSFPEGWTVEQKEGVYVAQSDPARKDSPSILFILSTASTTEDQLLDTMTDKFAGDFTVIQRAPISTKGGHFLIGDGVVEGSKVRVGALVFIVHGQALVCVFVAKAGEFDELGGIGLPALVAASVTLDA